MARRRYISTKISTDPNVNKLLMVPDIGEFATLLYTWMIPHAEDNASLTGDPEELLLLVMPGCRSRDAEDVIRALREMSRLKLIIWDEPAKLIKFPDSFYEYQNYINVDRRAAKPRTLPQNPAKPRTLPQNPIPHSHSDPHSHSHNIAFDQGRKEEEERSFLPSIVSSPQKEENFGRKEGGSLSFFKDAEKIVEHVKETPFAQCEKKFWAKLLQKKPLIELGPVIDSAIEYCAMEEFTPNNPAAWFAAYFKKGNSRASPQEEPEPPYYKPFPGSEQLQTKEN